MDDLRNRVALVTGASQGLGREIAFRLAGAGVRVAVNCAHHIDRAEAVAGAIRDKGFQAFAVQCDVGDEAAVEEMFANLGEVDILVNNARLDPYFRTPDCGEGEWFAAVMRVNVQGAFLAGRAFLRQAAPRRWGRIVNISSSRAYTPAEPGMEAYNISKAALHALSRSFAAQGAPFGITSNVVAPGMIDTENLRRRLAPEAVKRETERIPLGRAASMSEVADAVLFAAGSGYMTGEVININGGQFYQP